MTDLERNLSKVLEEHRHESGLHIIGGQQRLIDRLVEFFETGLYGKAAMPRARANWIAKGIDR